MGLRFLCFSWLFVTVLVGCYQESNQQIVEETEDEGQGGEVSYSTGPTSSHSSSSGGNSSVQEDEEFDPCPEVTYELLEDEHGTKYYVTIEVFCEPIQNLNLGCPAPLL